MVQYGGIGRHAPAVLDKIVIFLKLQPSFVITYALAVMFPKLAIICLYLRIFISRSYKITCYVLISILVATSLAVIVTTFVSCIPLAYLWEPQLHPGVSNTIENNFIIYSKIYQGWCINLNAFWRWGSFPNIVTDAIMIVLPIRKYPWRVIIEHGLTLLSSCYIPTSAFVQRQSRSHPNVRSWWNRSRIVMLALRCVLR